MRQRLIGAGFTLLGSMGLHRLAPAGLRGLGAILMFHHVRPSRSAAFSPNRLLEIEPAFLEAVVIRLRELGYDIVSMDEAMRRLAEPDPAAPPLAVLSFDDGYRDFTDFALPVLERHGAPFTLFVTTGFADRSAHLWWLELEAAISNATTVALPDGTGVVPASSPADKRFAFAAWYGHLRRSSEAELRAAMAALAARHGIDGRALTAALCLDWDAIVALARHPLATIGAHTLTHPRLAQVDAATMRIEMTRSRDDIAARIGKPVRHLAYPVGGADSAGPREFAAAADAGFACAVTTRPGLLYPEHQQHRTALPRLSVNGLWQNIRNIEVLLSGAAFALWNRGRRVDAA